MNIHIEPLVTPHSLNMRGDNPFVRLFCYGALMRKETFIARTQGEYEDEEIDIEADYDQYFGGMYKMPGRRLSFSKNKNGFGVGHIIPAADNEYVIGAVMIVPKSALREGSSDLCISEGCFSSDAYNPINHYTLGVNSSCALEPLGNSEGMNCARLSTQSTFYFLAGFSHTQSALLADPEYKLALTEALMARKNEGWAIPSDYIQFIKNRP
jgi:hypothetical protein